MSNTQLNMSQAAQAAGITRRTLYNHVKQGKVTTSRDEKNNPVVDVSELIRAYGNVSLSVKKIPTMTHRKNTQENFSSEQLQAMQKEIAELKRAVTHMLEDKTARESERKQYEEERRKYQEEISALNEKLERERKKGFWARLRG